MSIELRCSVLSVRVSSYQSLAPWGSLRRMGYDFDSFERFEFLSYVSKRLPSAMTDKERDARIAAVFIGTEGSTTYYPETWEAWKHAETEYAPEFLHSELRSKGIDPESCVTVLDYDWDLDAPRGYRRVYQFSAGEAHCPDCGNGTGNEGLRASCKLCDGDGLLYWGEECQVVVFAPIDPNATLKRLRELLERRDSVDALPESEAREFTRLFDSLDGYLTRSGSELPEGWSP